MAVARPADHASQRLNYRTDPLYRRLLAESANLMWQCVEEEFQMEQERLSSPATLELRIDDDPK